MDVIAVRSTRDMFLRVCREFACEECGLFLATVSDLQLEGLHRSVPSPLDIQEKLKGISPDFIAPGALYEIRIPSSLLQQVTQNFDPLTAKRTRRRSLWTTKRAKGKIFVSDLGSVRKDSLDMNNSSNVLPLVGVGQINHWKCILHLKEAADIANDLLRQKVVLSRVGIKLQWREI